MFFLVHFQDSEQQICFLAVQMFREGSYNSLSNQVISAWKGPKTVMNRIVSKSLACSDCSQDSRKVPAKLCCQACNLPGLQINEIKGITAGLQSESLSRCHG